MIADMEFETLKVERRDTHILLVTMNRPEVRNAKNTRMGLESKALFESLYVDTQDVRCVVLTGAGDKAFCAGGDLKERNNMTDAEWQRQHAIFEQGVRAVGTSIQNTNRNCTLAGPGDPSRQILDKLVVMIVEIFHDHGRVVCDQSQLGYAAVATIDHELYFSPTRVDRENKSLWKLNPTIFGCDYRSNSVGKRTNVVNTIPPTPNAPPHLRLRRQRKSFRIVAPQVEQ